MLNYDINSSFYSTSKYSTYSIQRSQYSPSLLSNHYPNAVKICEVLREFGVNVLDLSPDLFLQENKIIRMGVPPLQLEILTTISGVNFSDCYAEKLTVEIDEIEVNLISLSHLKLNKKASGRFKDLNDLENLS